MEKQKDQTPLDSLDPQYTRILAELESKRHKNSPKVVLSYDKYMQFIQLLQNLISFDEACRQIQIDPRTIQSYMNLCDEFTQVVQRSQMYAINLSKVKMVKLLQGEPAKTVKKVDRLGNQVEVTIPAQEPPYKFLQWFIENTDPNFTPKTKVDVNMGVSPVMERLLARYAKRNAGKTTE